MPKFRPLIDVYYYKYLTPTIEVKDILIIKIKFLININIYIYLYNIIIVKCFIEKKKKKLSI